MAAPYQQLTPITSREIESQVQDPVSPAKIDSMLAMDHLIDYDLTAAFNPNFTAGETSDGHPEDPE
jgi:hypothetical protein